MFEWACSIYACSQSPLGWRWGEEPFRLTGRATRVNGTCQLFLGLEKSVDHGDRGCDVSPLWCKHSVSLPSACFSGGVRGSVVARLHPGGDDGVLGARVRAHGGARLRATRLASHPGGHLRARRLLLHRLRRVSQCFGILCAKQGT